MISLLRYVKPREWGYLAVSVALIVFQVNLDLLLPDYMSEVTRLVETEGSTLAEVLVAGGSMLACSLGSLVTTIIASYFTAHIAAGIACTLRERLFDNTLDFSLSEFSRFSTASLITRCTNDLTQIQLVVAMGLQALVKAPIMAVWAVAKMAGKSWEWTLTAGGVTACLAAFIIVILVLVVPRFTRVQTLVDKLTQLAHEGIAGVRDIRAYNSQEWQQKRFGEANDQITDLNLFANRAMAFQGPAMTLAMSGMTLAIYWVGAYLIDAATPMDRVGLFSDMVAFSSYAMLVVQAFMMLTITFIMLPRAMVSARRVAEVIATKPEIVDGMLDSEYGPAGALGSIRFEHVSFRYAPDAGDVLRDVSFEVMPGQTVAIIGATGSGKTTLVNLIARLYDATEGQVVVNGLDVRTCTQLSLRSTLGLATQKPILFSGTVSSNVAYGYKSKRRTWEDVAHAVDVAQAGEFIELTQEGVEASVAAGGTNFSGGQRQRLSVARAVCRRPQIYLFDDTFSALDYRTDRALRSALAREAADATVVMVAQRVGTIRDADQIIVLDEGQVVGVGTHDELMRTCPVYREIAASQLTSEELDRE